MLVFNEIKQGVQSCVNGIKRFVLYKFWENLYKPPTTHIKVLTPSTCERHYKATHMGLLLTSFISTKHGQIDITNEIRIRVPNPVYAFGQVVQIIQAII